MTNILNFIILLWRVKKSNTFYSSFRDVCACRRTASSISAPREGHRMELLESKFLCPTRCWMTLWWKDSIIMDYKVSG